ncbi:hypothetical protein EW026_g1585 [Hermanssonia centrifuga]|uniref:Uncharacterized protein n=1 Tax=Hermanssonia centrifuga TaxID=98765 RepID=A0A4V6S114_9APHY|nr:hypothetical protein EW026_g1585 [Hermanssonia centrifuga]
MAQPSEIVAALEAEQISSLMFYSAAGTRIAVIVAEILLLAVTWHKTFWSWVLAARLGVHTPLTTLFLRDGTVYFVAQVLAISIIQMLRNILSSDSFTAFPIDDIIAVSIPILISRFLLNLRQVRELENATQGAWNSTFTIPGFRVPTLDSFVGNMGEELDFTLDDVPCETEGSISVEVPDPAVSHPAEEFDYEIQGVPRGVQYA